MSQPTNDTNENVIIDREDSTGFDVDWDTIEDNYKKSRHHRHSRRHHSSNVKEPATNKKKKKMGKGKKILLGILIFLLCLIVAIVSAFFIMKYQGSKKLLNYDELNIQVPDDVDYSDGGRTIKYNGHTYQFNSKIATILFMGIDNRELNDNQQDATIGQADALYLCTYDTTNGKIRVLCLNRDTITSVSRYDVEGNYYDTKDTQLCLAYAYGDGFNLSAENQVSAVERLIYNVPINAYYAIDLSAIAILNDDIGGVTVTPEYTFGSFTKGVETTILGDRAEEFVRHRDFTIVDDNLRRMSCQRMYISSFASQAVTAIKDDFSLPLKLYEHTMDYTITNMSTSDLTYLASTLATNFSGLDLITTEGTYKMVEDDKYAQFHVDKEDLFEKVLDIFYIQID